MILRRGISHPLVKDIQRILNVTETGFYGPMTEEAVKRYQKANGLRDDGIAGPKTIAHLMSKGSRFTEAEADVVQRVKPLNATMAMGEDFSDPEDEMKVGDVAESAPTCKFEEELILLISGASITRQIDEIYVHCSATQPTATVSAIQNYWRNTLGWKSPGYHILVTADKGFSYLQNFNLPSNGVAGRNSRSIHISYIGGIDRNGRPMDTRTPDQARLLERAIIELKRRFPNARLRGHNEVSNKACPSFNVKEVYKQYI
jgi:N-acetylmuramoyl-L-alanine amidase